MFLDYETAKIPHHDLKNTIDPIRRIFWGGILVFLEISVSTRNFKIDILNNTVGMLLVCFAIFRLAKLRIDDGYRRSMNFLKVVGIAGLIDTFGEYYKYDVPIPISILSALISLAGLAAGVVFCLAMIRLCRHAGLANSVRSWNVTAILIFVFYAVPLGIIYTVYIVTLCMGKNFPDPKLDSRSAVLWIFVWVAIPLIHYYYSTSRMKREITAAPISA